TIFALNFDDTDRFMLVAGASFTGSSTYSAAIPIPSTGIITNNLANPSTTVAYTLRFFDDKGCVKDTTFILEPVDCEFRTLGLAKAVSMPVLNNDGTYNITYTVIARNYDQTNFSKVLIVDDLSATFPAPSAFTVIAAPSSISGSGLVLNQNFNGSTQKNLTIDTLSSLSAGQSASFAFTLRVSITSFYKAFNNSAIGSAV